MSSRIGTAALYNLQNYYLLQTQNSVNDLTLQQTTQEKTQVFSGIASQTTSLLNLQNDISKRNAYVQGINGVMTRMQVADTAMDKIEKIAVDFQNTLLSMQNNTQSPKINDLARGDLQQVADYLNVKDGTRWIFNGTDATASDLPVDVSNLTYNSAAASGSFQNLSATQVGTANDFQATFTADSGVAVSQPTGNTQVVVGPVVPPAVPAAGPPGGQGFADYYYKTNTAAYPKRTFNETSQTFQASDNVRLSVGVNADANPFQRIIRTLSYFARIDPTVPNVSQKIDVSNVQAASAELTTALTELRGVRGTVSSQLQQLTTIKTDHSSFIAMGQNGVGSIIQADPAQTAVSLSAFRSQLENSYAAIGSVRSLSLVNYLK